MNNAVVYGSMIGYDVGSELIAETLSNRFADNLSEKYDLTSSIFIFFSL